jgi:hypothetical protein
MVRDVLSSRPHAGGIVSKTSESSVAQDAEKSADIARYVVVIDVALGAFERPRERVTANPATASLRGPHRLEGFDGEPIALL